MTTVAIPAETRPGERRVALVPEVVAKLKGLGLDVLIQAGAGLGANQPDAAYRDAGAEVRDGDVLSGADVVLAVNSLDVDAVHSLKSGARCPFFPGTQCFVGQGGRSTRLTGHVDVCGVDPANLQGSVDGRLVVAGFGCRVPLRARGG